MERGERGELAAEVRFDSTWTDEELTALALGDDPDRPLGDDAVPIDFGQGGSALLPVWYMPPVVARSYHRGWRTLALVLVFAFLFIEAAGLCSTYGQLVIP